MQNPFPADQVVDTWLPVSPDGLYWTRLKVPEDLPVFKDDRPWAAAIMAHFNPTSERCFAVALGTEEMIEPFLSLYPNGIGTGTPNDEKWATEIKASRQLTATRIEVKGIVVLNELPLDRISETEESTVYDGPRCPECGAETRVYPGRRYCDPRQRTQYACGWSEGPDPLPDDYYQGEAATDPVEALNAP